jgi:hypothetical protein
MRKLKLDLTDLEVTSFETRRDDGPRGTVAGHKTAPPSMAGDTYCGGTCDGGYSCDQSCGGTCPFSCWGDVCSYGVASNCAACYSNSCGQTFCCTVPIDAA